MEQQGGEAYPMEDAYLNYTRYEPVGVAGLITPWNAPFHADYLETRSMLGSGKYSGYQTSRNDTAFRFSIR